MKKNYILDRIFFIVVLICVATGLILDFHWFSGGREVKMLLTDWHRYTGYLMGIGLLLHLAWHIGWIRNVTKMLLQSPQGSEKQR